LKVVSTGQLAPCRYEESGAAQAARYPSRV
jgi:hypothetical protein